MSMTDIINSLSCKSDIQQNKTLMYQLQKLDETVKQSMPYKTAGPSNESESKETDDSHLKVDQSHNTPTIPFPFQLN